MKWRSLLIFYQLVTIPFKFPDLLIEKHADWAEEISKKNNITAENVHEVLQKEIGIVFAKVLEHAGVYKRNKDGKAAFERFIDYVNNK